MRMINKGSLVLRRLLVTELAALLSVPPPHLMIWEAARCWKLVSMSNTFRATRDPSNSADILAQEDSWSGPLNSQGASAGVNVKENQGAFDGSARRRERRANQKLRFSFPVCQSKPSICSTKTCWCNSESPHLVQPNDRWGGWGSAGLDSPVLFAYQDPTMGFCDVSVQREDAALTRSHRCFHDARHFPWPRVLQSVLHQNLVIELHSMPLPPIKASSVQPALLKLIWEDLLGLALVALEIVPHFLWPLRVVILGLLNLPPIYLGSGSQWMKMAQMHATHKFRNGPLAMGSARF